MLTKTFLNEQIAHHGERVEAYVLAYERARQDKKGGVMEIHLRDAATHATIFNALTVIAAGK